MNEHVSPTMPIARSALLPHRESTLRCVVCSASGAGAEAERGQVPSNVRAFADMSFRLWRCGTCDSIHAADDVDLDHFYAQYPFHELGLDWRLRVLYAEQRRRLEAAGLGHEQRVLDYGCGSGAFLRYLASVGY